MDQFHKVVPVLVELGHTRLDLQSYLFQIVIGTFYLKDKIPPLITATNSHLNYTSQLFISDCITLFGAFLLYKK